MRMSDWSSDVCSSDLTHADVIAAWLAASPSDRARLLPDLLSVACTKDGKLRAVQKGQTGAEPDYASLCERLHDSCSAILDLRARADLAEWLGVTLRAGWQVAQGYAAEKRSEERRVGKEGVSTGRSRGSPYH